MQYSMMLKPRIKGDWVSMRSSEWRGRRPAAAVSSVTGREKKKLKEKRASDDIVREVLLRKGVAVTVWW